MPIPGLTSSSRGFEIWRARSILATLLQVVGARKENSCSCPPGPGLLAIEKGPTLTRSLVSIYAPSSTSTSPAPSCSLHLFTKACESLACTSDTPSTLRPSSQTKWAPCSTPTSLASPPSTTVLMKVTQAKTSLTLTVRPAPDSLSQVHNLTILSARSWRPGARLLATMASRSSLEARPGPSQARLGHHTSENRFLKAGDSSLLP